MRIVVASEARDDLGAAVAYIAKDNPAAARRLLERIHEIVTLLAEGGLDGPRATLRSGLEVRSWPVPPLRIYYRREPDAFHLRVAQAPTVVHEEPPLETQRKIP